MEFLEEQGIGFDSGHGKIPIVPAAILFDLAVAKSRPDSKSGRSAAAAATSGVVSEGRVGAGAGATVAKWSGRREPGGLGTLSRDAGEWVVLTEIDPAASAALLRSLAPTVLAPRGDVSVFHLADQELLLARVDDLMLIAPDDDRGLFDAMVPNLLSAPQQSLAEHAAVKRGCELGAARAGVLIRHAPPLGGWSVAVADLEDDCLTVRHASRFDNTPFRSRITELTWDPAPLRCLEGTGFLGFIEPTDTAGGPFDAFVATLLGEP